jgi:hypothetical protein
VAETDRRPGGRRPDWELWAPPLDPPAENGLPRARAEAIARRYWKTDPHLAAALMWEEYAAMLPVTPAVASVSTGVQSMTYAPAWPGGAYGEALARAQWHRDQRGNLFTVPLRVAELDEGEPWPVDWWQRNLDEAP